MDSTYDFKRYEQEIYKRWEEQGLFSPDTYHKDDNDRAKFCIMMPPPNANDPLHIGHAMFVSLEDILVRYHRMLAEDVLWLPGTDHAGIETQFVFEKKLKKKNQSRFDFDRETLYQMIWDYVQDNSQVAVDQMKKLGASADWSRFKFMLDPKIVEVVLNTFKKLHDENLVYRDLRLVNYCTRCGTSYSELEVEHEDRSDPLYTIMYGSLPVATTRPETIFGDVALAVNPNDSRYKKFIGTKIKAEFPWGKVTLPVLADEYVKVDYGSGVLKITPYHDANDWEVWQRHIDEVSTPTQIISTNGKIINAPEPYLGQGVVNARKAVVDDLKQAGLLLEEKSIPHSIGLCYRCGRIIEPLPLPQFFISTEPLTKPIIAALDSGDFKVHGAGHDKILRHWLTNLRDWNISRQIVWGIRLPVWYNVDENPDLQVLFVDKNKQTHQGLIKDLLYSGYTFEDIVTGLQSLIAPAQSKYLISAAKPNLPGQWIQETDTFDTWFSSAQWPFSTLIASDNPNDFKRFYPTQVMETGYDILPFWVMRMLMIGNFATGELPFKNIYLHGLVRDQKGQKMSKSKGNVVNPIEIIDKYGADALRMALVIRSSAGLDKSVGEADFKAMRNFANKIWNAVRFVKTGLEENNDSTTSPGLADKEFYQHLDQVIANTTKQLNDFKIGLAAESVYNEFWHWFCDVCIEDAKSGKISNDAMKKGLEKFILLLHPFMPFVTEAVWQEINDQSKNYLISQSWPIASKLD